MRLLRTIATTLALGAVIAASASGAPTGPDARSVTAVLAPMGAASATLGAPFRFRATLTSKETFTKAVEFRIRHAGTDVAFLRELVVIPEGLSVELAQTVTPGQWFKGKGQYEVVAVVDGAPLGPPLRFEVGAARRAVPLFRDVTDAAKLTTSLPEPNCKRVSSGAAWADVDRDGRLDLFVTREELPTQLYLQQRGGTFVEESAARGVVGNGLSANGAVFADYDNDGDADLYVVNDGANLLYRNDGTGHFTDVTAAAGVQGGLFMHVTGSWADYDKDGWLDLYVANHGHCYRTTDLLLFANDPDQLFHNNGDGTFTDVSALVQPDRSLTPELLEGAGYIGTWFDYNSDGRPDLYVGNDNVGSRSDRNRLYRNDGRGADGQWHFTDVSIASGSSFLMNSMGIGVGDYDRDLDFDLAISNVGGNKLLRNNGDGSFRSVAEQAGVERPHQRAERYSVTWGALFGDFNLDGWEDLYVAGGYLIDWGISTLGQRDTPQTNQLFLNNWDGTFLDVSAPSGSDDPGQSRGVAAADYDRDGDLDLYVVNQGGSPHLFRNDTPRGKRHWLEVNPVGTRSNRDACGTRLVVTLRSGARLLREVSCGSTSVSSGSERVVHYGLGTALAVKQLEVTWPSGLKQTFRKVKLDRRLTLTEPKA
ncbi:MAG: CRTAC1 family protein [Gaiellaceae bacterium]